MMIVSAIWEEGGFYFAGKGLKEEEGKDEIIEG